MSVAEHPGPAGYDAPPRRRNGAGTAALVVGVVALVLAILVIFFLVAGLLGLVAAILGLVGIGRARRGEADNRGQAVAGLICGLMALVIAVVLGVRLGTFVNDHQSDLRSFWSCITSAPSDAEQRDCARELGRRLDR